MRLEMFNRAEGVAQIVESLPSQHKALSSNSNIAKVKKKV
jgi:hypothetical protein